MDMFIVTRLIVGLLHPQILTVFEDDFYNSNLMSKFGLWRRVILIIYLVKESVFLDSKLFRSRLEEADILNGGLLKRKTMS